MKPSEFRSIAHELVDWMADYLEDNEQYPVVPQVKPGEIRAQLPAHPPQQGEDFQDIWRDFQQLIVPGMTHWNHPGWFAYFPANHSPPSILAEMLMATMGAQCMSWQTSPAATELEQQVMEWLREMLGLPEGFTGSLQDTASTATLVALLSARERWLREHPGQTPKWAVYASQEAHSSIDKGVKLAGLGLENLRHIPSDEQFALQPKLLEQAIQEDLAQGHHPICVVATLGTTSSTGVDPLRPIGDICEKYGIWLHVDAAYAGSAAILPEKRAMLDGIEKADSFVFNPHKWLMTNFDCSAYYVRDVEALLHTFQNNPEYLKTLYDPEVVNFRDWHPQLGRRFRALKLWFVLRSYGVEGLQAILRQHLDWAQWLEREIRESADFELLAPVPFGLVCFRYNPTKHAWSPEECNAFNEQLLHRVNADGRLHITHTRLRGKYTLRLVVGQLWTEKRHVQQAWDLIQETAQGLEGEK
jgi:aromatic-L-amino-acid decarboxylase